LSTVYLGTSEFAAVILHRLVREEAHRPALVITRPDRPRGRGRRLSSPPVADAARELGLALEQPTNVNDPEVLELIARATAAEVEPATLIVCAFGALITEPLLSTHEILNVHPSLLPRWRGAAPVERAIMAGDQQTGVCIMRLTAGLDSGPVCLTGVEPISPQDTYGTLSERLQELGGELLMQALDQQLDFYEQPEQGVTYAEKIGPTDRVLDPTQSADALARVVRALHPHIGARLQFGEDAAIGVLRAQRTDASEQPGLGELLEDDGRLLLGCGEGVLELLEVQPAGGRAMEAAAYLRGYGLPGR
jgi:methionyl-tRNA formyltransferase